MANSERTTNDIQSTSLNIREDVDHILIVSSPIQKLHEHQPLLCEYLLIPLQNIEMERRRQHLPALSPLLIGTRQQPSADPFHYFAILHWFRDVFIALQKRSQWLMTEQNGKRNWANPDLKSRKVLEQLEESHWNNTGTVWCHPEFSAPFFELICELWIKRIRSSLQWTIR